MNIWFVSSVGPVISAHGDTSRRVRNIQVMTMPECEGCGTYLTPQYVRVFAPEGRETVEMCIHCSTDRERRRTQFGRS